MCYSPHFLSFHTPLEDDPDTTVTAVPAPQQTPSNQPPSGCKCCLILPCQHISNCPSTDWRMLLNNFLQINGGTRRLQYIDVVSGPAQQQTWHSTVYGKSEVPLCDVCSDLSLVDDIPYSQGYAGDKGKARENAARNCYMIVRSPPINPSHDPQTQSH